MRRSFRQVLLIIVLCGAMLAVHLADAQGNKIQFPTDTLVITTQDGPKTFTVELAVTNSEREQGLMYRDNLAMDHGMLFDFGSPQPIDMWMKNTRIPLDILFISQQGEVTRIAEQAKPYSLELINSGGRVRAVLELAGGAVKRYHIAIGDHITHSIFQ